jgi:hypothetical protein
VREVDEVEEAGQVGVDEVEVLRQPPDAGGRGGRVWMER